ncbi:MAG: hypothetical protein AABX17_00880 [Nanoarchaeota archaeon]
MAEKIPKEMFDPVRKNEKREYYFINLEGKKTSVSLSSADKLHPTARCPRDGARLIDYAGDPHRIVECPNCGYHPPTYSYSVTEDLARLKREQSDMQPRLDRVNNLIAMLFNPNHPVRQKNLKDEAMLKQK